METVWNKYVSRSVWFFLQKEKKIYIIDGDASISLKEASTRSPHMVG
jgi:hypothetical protein